MRRRRRKVSAKTKRKISRSLKGRRRSTRQREPESRLSQIERISRTARNVALASESPSKIARNASVTAKNISSLTSGVDRNLKRAGRLTSSLDNVTRSVSRFRP